MPSGGQPLQKGQEHKLALDALDEGHRGLAWGCYEALAFPGQHHCGLPSLVTGGGAFGSPAAARLRGVLFSWNPQLGEAPFTSCLEEALTLQPHAGLLQGGKAAAPVAS